MNEQVQMTPPGTGVISANDLMQRLVNAKKIINKVESGDYERGNIDENILRSNPEQLAMSMMGQAPPPRNMMPPTGPPNAQRIRESRLPDVIKQAMIDHPIEQADQISLVDSLDMNFVANTKRLMENDGVGTKRKKEIQSFASQRQAPVREQQQQPQQQSFSQPQNFDMSAITVLIENTIRKVLDEKLTQILSAQQTMSINENLVLKVGDSIFKGKITGVNKK